MILFAFVCCFCLKKRTLPFSNYATHMTKIAMNSVTYPEDSLLKAGKQRLHYTHTGSIFQDLSFTTIAHDVDPNNYIDSQTLKEQFSNSTV